MKQEITMIRMAGLRSGTMEVRITGVPFQMAEAWVTSRKNLGAATLTVESWTYSTPSQTLLATFSSPDVLSLEEAFFRRGWSYAADFKRIQFTDSPMCRCKAPSLSRDPAPEEEKKLPILRQLLDANTAHQVAHNMIREVLEKEKARREAAEARVRDMEEDRKKNHQTIQAYEADYIRARNKARGVQDELDETRASLQEADDHMRVLEMQYMKLHRKHWKAARVVGRYRRALESVVAENKRVRKDLRTLDPRSYYDDYIRAIEREETLEDGGKHLEAELEVEKDHVGILEQKNKDLIHQIDALTLRAASLWKMNATLSRKNITLQADLDKVSDLRLQAIKKNLALQADLKAEKERRKQDLSFLARDIAEETGGLVRISERVEALRAGKEPHPYKHNDERRD
ncbi:MAG: hypothetical protein WC277_07980 [Bacilli bacterium]